MRITVETLKSNLKYILDIDKRLTIIKGNSATGKSHLVRLIDEYGKSGVVIKSPLELIHVNSKILNAFNLKKDKNLLYVFDEDDGISDKNVINFINDINNNVIIITRDISLPEINYGIDNVYEFRESNKFNILVRKYDKINKNNINTRELSKILTEDSGSGFDFYSNLNNFKVNSAYGNSNIINCIENNQIIALDSLGIGPYIDNILNKIKNLNSYVIYPKSFEWLLLESGIFSKTSEISIKNFKNEEDFYNKLLKQTMLYYNKRYSKEKLNKWFLEDKQFDKILGKINELFKINLKELNNNLKTVKNHIFEWGDL